MPNNNQEKIASEGAGKAAKQNNADYLKADHLRQVNLTRAQNVVVEQPDLSPIPDYATVVFQKVGSGRRFRRLLGPGKVFRRMNPFKKYTAYAVRCDSDLRFNFTSWIKLRDHHQPIDLTFLVDYLVLYPEKIAASVISDHDPLARLKDRIEEEIGAVISSEPWLEIRDSLDLVARRAADQKGAAMAAVQNFAQTIGIQIRKISVKHNFIEKDQVIIGEIIDGRQKQTGQVIEQTLEGLAHEHHKELERKNKEIERKQALLDNITRDLGKAIDQLTEPIASPEGFRHTVETVVNTFKTLSGTISDLGGGGSRTAIEDSAFTAPVPALSPGGVEGMLYETIQQINRVGCSQPNKNRLLSAFLFLYAECLLTSRPNGEKLAQYKDLADDLIQELSCLKDDEARNLGKLCDINRIREALIL